VSEVEREESPHFAFFARSSKASDPQPSFAAPKISLSKFTIPTTKTQPIRDRQPHASITTRNKKREQSMPYHLERTLVIPRPRAEVFAFFANAENLERITPPFLHFQILTPPPIRIHAGATIDYQLTLFGIYFHWRTLIETFDPPSAFTDIQLTGPYRRWHHRHNFHEVPNGTEMHDQVEYEIPFGPLGTLAHTLFIRRTVNRIFDHRNQTILKLLTA
jgi:hypothetical protein